MRPRPSLFALSLAAASTASAQPLSHTGSALDARLVSAQGDVEVAVAPEAPGPLPLNPPPAGPAHPAAIGERLPRGSRVATGANGTADLSLGALRVHLNNSTRVVLFASAAPVTFPTPAPTATTLVRGSLRADMIEDSARTPFTSLGTPSATVFLGRGEAVVRADLSTQSTRVAVYRGRVRVRSGTREITLRAGNCVTATNGVTMSAGRPLPPPPLWTTLPPTVVVSGGEALDVAGRFALARGATAPAHWHIQVARDAAFTDVVSDTREPGRNLTFSQRALSPGAYFVRASAIDSEQFEGFPGAVANVRIAAPRVLPGAPNRTASVEIPPGFRCGLDGAMLALSPTPLPLAPGRNHRLRCASSPEGRDVREITIPAADAGELVHDIHLNPPRGDSNLAALSVRLQDAAGAPVSWASFTIRSTPGVHIAPLRETEQRGIYTAPVRWDNGVRGARIELRVNDAVTISQQVGVAPAGELVANTGIADEARP